jgi:hypothetical protein
LRGDTQEDIQYRAEKKKGGEMRETQLEIDRGEGREERDR